VIFFLALTIMKAIPEMPVDIDFKPRQWENNLIGNTAKAEILAQSEDTNADNTRKPTRYSDEQFRTAMDQSNDPADIKMTAEIRKWVVGDDSLSITAKNVMIITIDGCVTLRGVVETQNEKSIIERHAKQIGANTIINQLEIKGS
jgi:hyperosmotically inducible periplasmic protein